MQHVIQTPSALIWYFEWARLFFLYIICVTFVFIIFFFLYKHTIIIIIANNIILRACERASVPRSFRSCWSEIISCCCDRRVWFMISGSGWDSHSRLSALISGVTLPYFIGWEVTSRFGACRESVRRKCKSNIISQTASAVYAFDYNTIIYTSQLLTFLYCVPIFSL